MKVISQRHRKRQVFSVCLSVRPTPVLLLARICECLIPREQGRRFSEGISGSENEICIIYVNIPWMFTDFSLGVLRTQSSQWKMQSFVKGITAL